MKLLAVHLLMTHRTETKRATHRPALLLENKYDIIFVLGVKPNQIHLKRADKFNEKTIKTSQ